MKTQSAKAKGRRLQQKVAADIVGAFDALTEDDVRSTSMGAGGEDVLLSPAAQRLFPYSVEAKNQERVNVWGALAQARANCQNREPIVVLKKNQEAPYVLVRWEHFLELVRAQRGGERDETLPARLRACADMLEQAEV